MGVWKGRILILIILSTGIIVNLISEEGTQDIYSQTDIFHIKELSIRKVFVYT